MIQAKAIPYFAGSDMEPIAAAVQGSCSLIVDNAYLDAQRGQPEGTHQPAGCTSGDLGSHEIHKCAEFQRDSTLLVRPQL
jgi:hypothetical protein